MKEKMRWICLSVLSVIMGSIVWMGCGEVKKAEMMETEETEETELLENIVEEDVSVKDFSFKDISNLEFVFESGADIWETVIRIEEDGTFEGRYYDLNSDILGEDFPKGEVCLCEFSGKFTQPEKVDEYIYSTRIESIECVDMPGTKEIVDEVLYSYVGPHGLENAEEILIYIPGVSLSKVPQDYQEWARYYILFQETALPYYALYNVVEECGFAGCPEGLVSEGVGEEDAENEIADVNIDVELANVEAVAGVWNRFLCEAPLTQYGLNIAAGKLYRVWDDELNIIWQRLKEDLNEEEMAVLLEEQRAWLEYKRREVEAAGLEFERGSMRPMIECLRSAELTKERVYELAELVR